MIAVAAVLALAAALAGRANKPRSALAGASAVDAVHADTIAEAGAPSLPRAGLALWPEEASTALPGLQAEKHHAEGQHQGRGGPWPLQAWLYACGHWAPSLGTAAGWREL